VRGKESTVRELKLETWSQKGGGIKKKKGLPIKKRGKIVAKFRGFTAKGTVPKRKREKTFTGGGVGQIGECRGTTQHKNNKKKKKKKYRKNGAPARGHGAAK